jgi:translation initiation factor 1 (eIF-1/SUI1)
MVWRYLNEGGVVVVKSRKRVPLGESAPLADNPFAALEGEASDDDASSRVTVPASGSAKSPPAYSVEKTRKGGWPLSLEKRRGGKTVTVLDRVSGDAKGLLKRLRRECGAGGSLQDERIEIQGDHVNVMHALLDADREKK